MSPCHVAAMTDPVRSLSDRLRSHLQSLSNKLEDADQIQVLPRHGAEQSTDWQATITWHRAPFRADHAAPQ